MAVCGTEDICQMLLYTDSVPAPEPFEVRLSPEQPLAIDNLIRKHGRCSLVRYDRDTGLLHVYYHFTIDPDGKVATESDYAR